MKTYKEIRTIERVLHFTNCDVCGKGIYPYSLAEMVNISYIAGYGSVFGNRNRVELDICSNCLKEKLGEFIRVTIYEEEEKE